jgi:subtilisin-like proprotein convertase family protein/subtilisin family serine protease
MPQTYTYRNGRKVVLEKSPDQFVVRATPERLEEVGIEDAEQVSSVSSRVTTRASDLEPMMSAARHIAPAHHAYYDAESGEEFLITDRVIVTFKQPPAAEELDAFAAKYALIKQAAYSDREFLYQLTDHTGMNPVKLVVRLMENEPMVESAEHDLNHRVTVYQPFGLPTDPAFAREWHLHEQFIHDDFDRRSSSRCEAAWQLLQNFGSANVVVGVTDDGCKLNHPDFDSPGKFAAWGYFRGQRLITNLDIDANPNEMYIPGANHGTSCAGVIAGEADAVLTVGAAPGCRLLPIQWESNGPFLLLSDTKLRTALDFIADKVDVMSNSWGKVPLNEFPPLVTNRLAQLAQTGGRRGRGIVFLWAAGNENCLINHTADQDVPFTPGFDRRPDGSLVWIGVRTARRFINSIVGIPGVVHVAALNSIAQRSHYSNYGPGILICAPTNNVHEYRRLTVRGLGITTTTGEAAAVTDFFGGTSSATPLVAGIAALVISANPDLTALEVISILKRTASKDLDFTPYLRTPPAIFDPDPVWDVSPIAPFNTGAFQNINDPDGTWSPWFGHGKVDAASAVNEALGGIPVPSPSVIRKTSSPALNIPDNKQSGVQDTINITDRARVASIKVSVDITHTFIGDLRVTLTSPEGTTISLHDRNGGNADNLRQTFDLTSTPGLGALNLQSVQGNWTLLVQDLAPADVGRLNSWELEITAGSNNLITLEDAAGVNIPDNNPTGIERALAATAAGQVRDVEVSVDITHTFIGDLLVTLVSPAGTNVILHQRAGGGADNLIKTFVPAATPGLQTLRGQQIEGAWKLKVADLVAVDVGKLNRWGLMIVPMA